MHVPDGFLDVPTSIATGAIAAGAIGLALHRSGQELRRAGTPLAGLTAVFVFAAQMVNFPVGAGTSGHLIGGALAAILVGPWTAVLCLSVVLLVQGLFFADGGLTALGTNITLMGVVAVLVGYLVARAVVAVLPKRPGSVVAASAAGAFVSVPAAALAFVVLYAVGGAVPVPLGTLAAAMVGWHLVIGIGEAVITAAVVGAVVATRPDLVQLARRSLPPVQLVDAEGRPVAATGAAPTGRSAAGTRGVLAVAASVCLLVAGGVSLLASSHPDGLEFVGESLGFAGSSRDSAVAGSPLADYGLTFLPGAGGAALAGIVGVLLTAALAMLVLSLRRRFAAERGAPDRVDA